MAERMEQNRSVALVGANGMLARMLQKRAPQGLDVHCYDLPDFDLTDETQVKETFLELRPQVIINAAAFTAVDKCEEQEALATHVNADGVSSLADVACEIGATLVHISTDYVFSGEQNRPYCEDDPTGPVSAYGRSKLKGELAILESPLEDYYIIRTSWLYGPDGPNFVETILRLAAEREEISIVHDQIGNPTFAGDLADAVFNLLGLSTDPQPEAPSPFGIYHFANQGQCSWYEFACEIVAVARTFGIILEVKNIVPIETKDYPLPAPRPAYSVLDKQKYVRTTGVDIPAWQESLNLYFTIRNNEMLCGGRT